MDTSPNARPATLDAATLHEMVDSGRAPRLLDVRAPVATVVGRPGDQATTRPLP
ncbi:hypothetical protein ACSNN9_20965 [Micromonospora sp. URMC 107]|uniref:hypothetical protein n=1 Tax=Micromonospora sp. URMC 107 TaxID=3423418 RepID=UPI003F19B463